MENSNSKLTRRSFMALAGGAAAMAGLALAGCGNTGDTGTTEPADDGAATDAADEPAAETASGSGKTFIYAIAGDPSVSPNPITTSDRYGLMTLKLIFSPLFQYNADGIEYFLAESYEESDDHLTYTIHLREDATFINGDPVTADDCIFSLETMRDIDGANQQSYLNYGDQGMVTFEEIDEHTFTATFPFLNAGAIEMLGGSMIMPRSVYGEVTDFENDPTVDNPVGSGPYKLVEYLPGQYISFEANPDYYLGAPKIDNVVFQIITNENTGMTAIQAGEVNAWIGTANQVQQMDIEGNNLVVTPYSEGRVAYMCFNCAREAVADERVRKAVLYTFDKTAIADAACLSSDYYELPWSFLPPENQYAASEDEVEIYAQDVEKAKSLLEEAGVSNLELTLAYSGSDTLQQAAAVMMQEQAAAAGITLNLQGVDATALSTAMYEADNNYDMYFGGYIMGIDPDTYTALFKTDGSANYMHYTADEYGQIDELFDEGRAETDPDARREIYVELQKVLQDTGAFYPLYSNLRLLVTTGNVTNIEEAGLVPVYTFEDLSKLDMTE